MANRSLWLVVGYQTHDASEAPTELYLGKDGVAAEAAAAKACATGNYANGQILKKLITDWIPRAVIPTEPKLATTKPGAIDQPTKTKATMKRTFSTIAAAAMLLFASLPVFGQGFGSQPAYGSANLSLTGIGTTASSTTTTVTNQIMDVRYFQNVTLATKFNFSGATTSNVVYSIAKSLDRSTWETTPSVTWTVTPSATDSTNHCVATTTIATGGCGWLKLVSIQNTHGSLVLTNELFQYSIKRSAP